VESLSRALERVARFVARRPLPVLAVVAVLAVGGAVLGLSLEPSAGTSTLVSRSSDTYKATADYHRRFGDVIRRPLDRFEERVPSRCASP